MQLGNRNVLTVTGKLLELAEKAKKYHLNIAGAFSAKKRGSRFVNLDGGRKLFCSSANPSTYALACVGILASPQLSDCVFNWIPSRSLVCLLKFKVNDRSLCLLQVYAPFAMSKNQAFVDDANDALRRVASTDSAILSGDFNSRIRTDNETWKGVFGRHLTRTAGIYCS